MITDFHMLEESITICTENREFTITMLEFELFVAKTFRLDVVEQWFGCNHLTKNNSISMEEYWQLDPQYHLVDLQDFLNSKNKPT